MRGCSFEGLSQKEYLQEKDRIAERAVKDFEKMSYGMYFLEIADYYGREGLEAADALNPSEETMKEAPCSSSTTETNGA